jgi:hypothetical protein
MLRPVLCVYIKTCTLITSILHVPMDPYTEPHTAMRATMTFSMIFPRPRACIVLEPARTARAVHAVTKSKDVTRVHLFQTLRAEKRSSVLLNEDVICAYTWGFRRRTQTRALTAVASLSTHTLAHSDTAVRALDSLDELLEQKGA